MFFGSLEHSPVDFSAFFRSILKGVFGVLDSMFRGPMERVSGVSATLIQVMIVKAFGIPTKKSWSRSPRKDRLAFRTYFHSYMLQISE